VFGIQSKWRIAAICWRKARRRQVPTLFIMKKPRLLGAAPQGARRRYDADRRAAYPWRAWYGLAAWKRRREMQLGEQPLCERHLKRGLVVRATVANHVERHSGDWDKFIRGKLESLCKRCHDSEVQAEEKAEARARQGGGSKV
jgi:5-methylcytosine-specific restriction protein A